MQEASTTLTEASSCLTGRPVLGSMVWERRPVLRQAKIPVVSGGGKGQVLQGKNPLESPAAGYRFLDRDPPGVSAGIAAAGSHLASQFHHMPGEVHFGQDFREPVDGIPLGDCREVQVKGRLALANRGIPGIQFNFGPTASQLQLLDLGGRRRPMRGEAQVRTPRH